MRTSSVYRLPFTLLLSLCLPFATAGSVKSGDVLDDALLEETQLDDAALADLRGGFEDDRFPNFAFSYERVAIVNDVIVAHEFVTLPGVAAPRNNGEGLLNIDISQYMIPDGNHMPGENDPMVITDGLTTTIQIMGDNQSVMNFETYNIELYNPDIQGIRPLIRSVHDSVVDTILNNF